MTEYIKRADAIKAITRNHDEVLSVADAIEDLESIPSADVVEIKKDGEWDMFDLISSAYYGKGMYFKQDNDMVYSRHSGEYMTVDEAIREFISLIDIDELTDTNVGKWIPVTERLPESVRKSYLCLTDTGYHCEARWTNNVYGHLWTSGNEWGWSIADVPQYCKVTHWMPLPEPPKEVKES